MTMATLTAHILDGVLRIVGAGVAAFSLLDLCGLLTRR